MRIKQAFWTAAIISLAAIAFESSGHAHTPAQGQAQPTSGQSSSNQTGPSENANGQSQDSQPTMASAILQSSLDGLGQTINNLKLEKWKGGSVRAEATANVGSIQRDLKGNLPVLIADSDSDPRSTSKLLLVSRNVNALYDVLLRVYDASRVAAPGEQISQLEQAMSGVDKARRNLDDAIRDLALSKEKQVMTLEASLKAQPAPVCPAPPPPPQAATAPKKKVVKKKPRPPASTPPANAQPAPASGASAKPNGN